MCLAVPGKILSIYDHEEMKMARVDFSGVVKDISVQWLSDEVQPGDYILAHVGMALNKIDEEEALETLKLLKELGEITLE